MKTMEKVTIDVDRPLLERISRLLSEQGHFKLIDLKRVEDINSKVKKLLK